MKLRLLLVSFSMLLVLTGLVRAGEYVLKPTDPTLPHNPYGGTIAWNGSSSNYGSYETGYGSGIAGASYVSCSGTITTVYEWQRDEIEDPNDPGEMIDDPLDNPPAEVVSKQYCFAMAVATSVASSPIAVSDNGLGFEPEIGGYGLGAYSICEGTLYTKIAGGQEITLTCTPSAYAESDATDATASVLYRSAIIVPKVEILGATPLTSPLDLKVQTGQQITCWVTQTTTDPIPSEPLPLAAYSWGTEAPPGVELVDPMLFKSYTHTTSLGKLNHHARSDVIQPTYSFFTGDNGVIVVKCVVTFGPAPEGSMYAGGLPSFTAKSPILTSKRPIGDFGAVASGQVVLNDPDNFQFGTAALNGQRWTGVHIDPSPFSAEGQGCFVQLISAQRDVYRNTSPGLPSHFTYSTSGALDTAFPYPLPSSGWNLPGDGVFEDSPLQPLNLYLGTGGNDWYRSSADDSFEVWALYKPPSVQNQATTWVPFAKYSWSWTGLAEKTGGSWGMTAGSGGPTSGLQSSKIFPEWNTFSPSPFQFIGVPPQ
ncbi:MAG: hypothetical protein M9921_13230 [Fimbriimonadaceae bacterium]|nr:hypothetical protein [Fimbriimonadaceae bacterium]